MNLLFFCLSLTLQGAPAQSELHPAEADLFVSVPDVQAIVQAYGDAPLLKTVRDEEMQVFLAGLGVELEADHRALLKEWIDQLHPGASALLDHLQAFSLSFTLEAEAEKPFGIGIVATFSAPEHALAAQELALSSGTPVGGDEVAGLPGMQRFTSAEMEGMELWCATAGTRFALGGGSTAATGFAARLAGEDPGLGGNELLAGARAAFGAGSGATVGWLFQARSPLELLGEAGSMLGGAMAMPYDSIPSFLDPLGGRRVLRMQLRDSRFVTEMFSHGGMEAGALGGQPLPGDWLARVPPGAMLAYSTAVDGAKLAPRLRELLSLAAGAVPQETADLKDDASELIKVLGGVGPGMVAYMFPVSGISPPQTNAWFDVADAAAFTAKMTSLCEKLAQTRPGFGARTRPYKVRNRETGDRQPFDVTTITLPPEAQFMGPMFELSPAFAVVENKILFGLSSTDVKRELKRLYAGEDAGAGNPWTMHGFDVPSDARSAVFMDWGLQLETGINLVRALGGMAGDQMPFDLAALPDARTFTQYLRPTFHVSRDVEGGTYRYHEASFGPETWLGIAGALLMGREESTVPATPLLPAPVESDPAGDGD